MKGVECALRTHIHTNIMKKNIKAKDFEVILNSTCTGTVINVKYTATSPTGEFPGISEFDNFRISKEIYPTKKLVVKDKYNNYVLQMLTAFLVYAKAMNDLQTNNIVESDMCGLLIEDDLKCTYAFGMPTLSNAQAKIAIEYIDELRRKIHSERTKLGIRNKRNG